MFLQNEGIMIVLYIVWRNILGIASVRIHLFFEIFKFLFNKQLEMLLEIFEGLLMEIFGKYGLWN